MNRRVVVTGMGVVAPNAVGLKAFETALRKGISGVRFLPELRALGFGCQVAGVPALPPEPAKGCWGEEEGQAMNSNMVYASLAGLEAWADAGLPRHPPDEAEVDWDTGAIIGTGIGGMDTITDRLVDPVRQGRVRRLGSTLVEQIMTSASSARLSGFLGLGNWVTTNSSACTTGTEAIVTALRMIRGGYARRMLAGGSEGSSPYIWAGFDAMRILMRKSNDAPERASRPLSARAAGFVPAAGAGVLVLEELETARQRGARIYAELLGGALNCGGQRMGGSMTAPNPMGIRRCIRQALADARVGGDEVDTINGHLTSTGADPGEIHAWADALNRPPERFPTITATKSMTGHALGAAGAIETIASVLMVHHGFVHPCLNCEDLHPQLEAFRTAIPYRPEDHPPPRVLAKAGFGFGDVNACIVLRRWEEGDGRQEP